MMKFSAEAMFYDGVSVEIRSAADDNRKQAEDVHYFIDEGVDLMIISPNEAAPMTPIVEEAYQKGIHCHPGRPEDSF